MDYWLPSLNRLPLHGKHGVGGMWYKEATVTGERGPPPAGPLCPQVQGPGKGGDGSSRAFAEWMGLKALNSRSAIVLDLRGPRPGMEMKAVAGERGEDCFGGC